MGFPNDIEAGQGSVLGDVLSRAPHIIDGRLDLNNLDIVQLKVDLNLQVEYPSDQSFGDIYQALQGTWPTKSTDKSRVEKVIHNYSLDDEGILYHHHQICIPRKCVKRLLHFAHNILIGGHFGVGKTFNRLRKFTWKRKWKDVELYVHGCRTCQQHKTLQRKKLSNPEALSLPHRRWGTVSTDFIVHLPCTTNGFDAIFTWVDQFSKRVRFIPTITTATAEDCAQSFVRNIMPFFGFPDEIISDRDPKFTSLFWRSVLDNCNVSLRMSTSHHPQTDGLSEIMNKMVENYIRCFCNFNQTNWDYIIAAAEFSYNSSVGEDTGMSPFELDLGWQPRNPVDLMFRSCDDGSVDGSPGGVDEFKSNLKSIFDNALLDQESSKAKQAAYRTRKYQPYEYTTGDQLLVDSVLFKDEVSQSTTE